MRILACVVLVLSFKLWGAGPHADSTPAGKAVDGCSFETVTDGCKLFDAKLDKLAHKDGTFTPNLPKILAGKPHSDFEVYKEAFEKDKVLQNKKFQLQRKIDKLLRRVPNAFMHPDYKIYMRDPQKLLELSMVVNDVDNDKPEETADNTVNLWWPPNKPDPADAPDEKLIKLRDAREKIRRCFPTKSMRKEFNDLMDDVVDLADAAAAVAAEGKRKRPGRFAEKPGSAPSNEIKQHPTVKEMYAVTPERTKRIEELMKFSRDAIFDVIRRGRKDADLSEDERQMIKKIEAVHFVSDPADASANSSCVGVVPNAFYSPEEHSITLCRQYYNLPDADIVSTLGHELFHAIDPCNSQFDTYAVDSTEFQKLREGKDMFPVKEIRDDNERFGVFQSLISGASTGKTAGNFGLTSAPSAVDYFATKKVLAPLAKGCKFPAYPFRGVYACLKKPEHGAFRSESPERLAKFAKEIASERRKIRAHDPAYDPEKDAAEIQKAFEAYPECLSTDYRTQMCETMSDWAGAKVLGKFLKDKKLATPADKVGAISLFAIDGCLRRAQVKRGGASKRPSAIVSGALDTIAELQDEHPDPVKRVNDIVLRDENVALALCGKAPTTKSCEEETR